LILKLTAKAPGRRPSARDVARALGGGQAAKPQARKPKPQAMPRADWGMVSHESGHEQLQAGWTPDKIIPLDGPVDLEDTVRGRIGDDYTIDIEDTEDGQTADVEVGDKLGRGAMGFAYDGVVPGQSDPVVVKVISRKFRKKPELMERILAALRDATRLRDPHVVATLDVRRVGDRDLVVQEKARARPLRSLLDERTRLPAPEALEVALGVAKALRAAAALGLSHGDIRPEKVYVGPSGDARLADFGQAEASCLGAGHGKHGVRLGHPTYLAPEVVQERRRKPDLRSDIYALGILLYETLCGKPPFRGASTRDLLVAHLQSPLPPPPDEVVLPRLLAETLFRMTSKAPAKRYGTPQELVDALEGCRAELGEPEAAPSASASDSGSFYLSDEVQIEEWGQESLLLSQPDGEWDKSRISHNSTAAVQVEEWSPDLSSDNSARLYEMMSSQEVLTTSRDELLAELGIDALKAAAGFKKEKQKAASKCKLCGKALTQEDLDYGRICMACRAAEVSMRGEDAGEKKHRALSKVVRVQDERTVLLKTGAFGTLFLLGISGLLWTLGLSLPLAISLGSLAAFFGAMAVYRGLSYS
jgi:serine/threonine protein kinase